MPPSRNPLPVPIVHHCAKMTFMATLDPEKKAKIVSIVLEKMPSATAIYLFGSMADGFERKDSDVDIAILQATPIIPDVAFNLRGVLGAFLKRDVDIVDCRRCKLEMAFNIVMGGVALFASDADAVGLYENTIMSMYANFAIERRELMKDIAQTGTIYGR